MAPTTVTDVVRELAAHEDEDPRVLAGGQSLVPLMNFRLAHPGYIVDLRRVGELSHIKVDGEVLAIGAMVRQSTAEHSPEVAAFAPMLAEALGHVAHPPIRNSGTVGGSIAHADPSAELPAVVVALDADLVATGPAGSRSIPAGEFFHGPFTTALQPCEILTEVRITRRGGRQAFIEFTRTHGSFALVGVGVSIELSGDAVSAVSIGLSGVAPTPVRAPVAERVLLGAVPDGATVRAAADAAAAALSPAGDLHGSTRSRVDIARSYVRRGIDLALARARREN
ncbi:FAD binding domain-containing protein [Spirillospora sp. CA-255316]